MLRFVRPKKYLPALEGAYFSCAPQAARDGLEFASMLSGMYDKVRPMASRKNRIRQVVSGAPSISDRAVCVLGGVMKVADLISLKRRPAVLLHSILTFSLQRWMLSLGLELRSKLLEALEASERTPVEWLQKPFEGIWTFNLSCKGLRPGSPECELCNPEDT